MTLKGRPDTEYDNERMAELLAELDDEQERVDAERDALHRHDPFLIFTAQFSPPARGESRLTTGSSTGPDALAHIPARRIGVDPSSKNGPGSGANAVEALPTDELRST